MNHSSQIIIYMISTLISLFTYMMSSMFNATQYISTVIWELTYQSCIAFDNKKKLL